jgi:pyrrolidone-carboxylate peptidase
MAVKVLLTSFESFDGRITNSSGELVEAIDMPSLSIDKLEVPVEYDRAWTAVHSGYSDHDVILAVGERARGSKLQFEWLAQNVQDAEIADNAGVLCRHKIINSSQPLALESTFEKRSVIRFCDEQEHWMLSYFAGTYVCNRLYFDLIARLGHGGKKVGFVHCPVFDKDDAQVLTFGHAKQALENLLSAISREKVV